MKFFLVALSVGSMLTACGESSEPAAEASKPDAAVEQQPLVDAAPAPVAETTAAVVAETETMTEVVTDTVVAQAEEVVATVEAVSAEVVADASIAIEDIVSVDKPYQLVAGKISENAMEGWRTYNGGGCGACHGKGGIGAVGPNLAESVTQKLSKEEFFEVVTNGRPGTMMRPHNTNARVMDNLENLYAYLVARGDGVLGPGNLIKSPLGKE